MSTLPWTEPQQWPTDAARERIIGDWHLYQRRGGHRTSTDDVLTAWFASKCFGQRPRAYLDLGCGIASVLLLTAYRLRPDRCVGVEAQPQSVLMARRAISELPSGSPDITIVHSDFRQFDANKNRFDLITGSPPYFPLGTGSLPDDPQRRACRFEARGGVEAYCETAARHLAVNGSFVLVFQTLWNERVLAAASEVGLHLHARADLKMRVDRPQPFLSVYHFRQEAPAADVTQYGFAIRDAQGKISAEYRDARQSLGLSTSD